MDVAVYRAKYQAETISLIEDFSEEVGIVLPISNPAILVEVWSGEDPSPQDMVYQAPFTLKGKAIEQRFRLGVPGNIYLITWRCEDASSREWERQGKLAIIPVVGNAVPNWLPFWETSNLYPVVPVDGLHFQHRLIVGDKHQTSALPLENMRFTHKLVGGQFSSGHIVPYKTQENIQFHHLILGGNVVSGPDPIQYSVKFEGMTYRHIIIGGNMSGTGLTYHIPGETMNFHHLITGGTLT